MHTSTPDIDALVVSAQEGDKDAFGILYDHFFEPIHKYVYFRVQSEEVDDLVENIFLKVWLNLERYEKRDVSFSSWLFRIAHNVVIDHRRSHRSLAELDPEIKDESERAMPVRQVHDRMVASRVREEIQKLKEPYRQVVTLKFLVGLSNAEIAEILSEREANVRLIQFRALKELKSRFEEAGIKAEILQES